MPKHNQIKIHKEASVMEEYDITELKASIAKHGQLQPVILWFDKRTNDWYLVDGRHRLKACDALGKEVKTMKLSKKTKEEDLPNVILTQQLVKRGLDKVIANCEEVLYLERVKRTVKNLVDEFSILTEQNIKFLKTIKEVRPLWFAKLRNNESIFVDGKNTRSLQALYRICQDEKKGTSSHADKEQGGKDVAIAFEAVKPMVEALMSVVGTDETRFYAMGQLIAKYPVHISTFGKSKDVSNVLTLEAELQKQKDYIKDLETNISAKEAVITTLKSMIPRNAKTAKKMRKFSAPNSRNERIKKQALKSQRA